MITNSVKQKLADGQLVVGSFVFIPSSKLTEIISLTGFDFVVIDMEHGPVDIETAEDMVRAADWTGITPIIRVAYNTPHLIKRALDTGAVGVHAPEINDTDGAKALAASVKYSPEGDRGLAGVRASKYGMKGSIAEYTTAANRETMAIAHIENVKAIEHLDDLLRVDNIDVYFLGPTDLSNSLGIPGQSQDSRVVDLVEKSIKRIVAAGKTAGCITADTDIAKRYIDLGVRYLATHAIKFMVNGSKQFIEEVQS